MPVITVWRAISPPPQDKPLALLDRRTVDPKDLILEQIAAPHTAFHDPTCAADTPTRHSIEARAYAFLKGQVP